MDCYRALVADCQIPRCVVICVKAKPRIAVSRYSQIVLRISGAISCNLNSKTGAKGNWESSIGVDNSTLFLSSPFACRQGGRHTTGNAYFSLPVAFPSAILSTVALGENNCLTEFVKLIGYNRTAIALQSISREGGDCGARPIQWIAVGY